MGVKGEREKKTFKESWPWLGRWLSVYDLTHEYEYWSSDPQNSCENQAGMGHLNTQEEDISDSQGKLATGPDGIGKFQVQRETLVQ